MHDYPFRCCTEIDLSKLQRNLKRLRSIIGPECKIMDVMKADAYGHGIRLCSRYAAPLVDWFAAATLEEALVIREEVPEKPILILGGLMDREILEAAEHRLTIVLFSLEYARHVQALLAENGMQIDGHIKFDTGMHRIGLRAHAGELEAAVEAAEELFALPNIRVTGLYTHFACSDTEDSSDISFSDEQFRAFTQLCDRLREKGLNVGLRHCASTGGMLCHPEYRLDMVRCGMFPLGQSISEKSAADLGLEPVLTWYARVIDLRDVRAGESVGYGRLYRAEKDRRIAVLSAGYADGYSRAYSNRAKVILNDRLVPVIGKTCMDFILVDVTGADAVKVGDQAVLLGKEKELWISADQLACCVPYNTNGGVTTEITARVRRVYRFEDQIIAVSDVRY